jgi:uncharacterized membrane protein YwaF
VGVVPFNIPWFSFMVALAVVGVAVHFVLRRFDLEGRRKGLLTMAIANAVLYAGYVYALWRDEDYPFVFARELPLHFCSLVTLGLVVTLATNSSALKCLCYFPGALGGFMALVSPAADYTGRSVFSLFSVGFFGAHGMNFVLSVLIATLGLYTPTYRQAVRAVKLFLVMCGSMLVVDLLLRALADPTTNYFYFFHPEGAGVLEALYKLIPFPILYEVPLLPFAFGVFLLQAAAYQRGRRWADQVGAWTTRRAERRALTYDLQG